jgi:hypothetical protein
MDGINARTAGSGPGLRLTMQVMSQACGMAGSWVSLTAV